METHVTQINIDSAGRVVIPKALRDELGLTPETPIRVAKEAGRIILSPERPRSRLKKKHGLWVISSDSGETITQEDVTAALEAVRREREEAILGDFQK